MTEPGSDVQHKLRALRRDYAARLPDRAAEIATRFEALRSRWCPLEAAELKRLAHNLAGSGASYGFPEVSADARRVEHAVDAVLVAPHALGSLGAVSAALQDLIATALAVRAD